MNEKKCEINGCNNLAKRFNAKYCEKHAKEQQRKSWIKYKDKIRYKNVVPYSEKWYQIMKKTMQGINIENGVSDDTVKLLKQIKKNTEAILRKLDKMKK